MKPLFPSESCKEAQISTINPQSWLQVERGKLAKQSSFISPSSTESLIKVPEPPLVPYFKPTDYVEVLAQIHEELESCSRHEMSNLYLMKFQVFRGLSDVKLRRRNLHLALKNASTPYEKIIYGAWLKYEKRGEEHISDLLASCGKISNDTKLIDVPSELQTEITGSGQPAVVSRPCVSKTVLFKIGDEAIPCNRQKMSTLSAPFFTMLYGTFSESLLDEIDFSENNISAAGFRAISEFSVTGSLDIATPDLLLEILIFANKFCCERLKDACDKKLASYVSSKGYLVELMEYALEENAPILAASCLQVLLLELPDSLDDDRVVDLFSRANRFEQMIMVGPCSFPLYCLLSEVAMDIDPRANKTALFLEQLVKAAETSHQKMFAFHKLGCVRLLRKEFDEAQRYFEIALEAGHTYSVCGLARLSCISGNKPQAYERLSSVISSVTPLGWMYQERSLCCDEDKILEDLDKASELDPTLTYPYMCRAAMLMKKQNAYAALDEISRVLGFKLALECLELRFCFYLSMEDYPAALCDVQAILTLAPNYRMFDGRVAASQLRTLVHEHVDYWTTADFWLQLYDRWSSVDDIGSLSVIYQMLESDAAKGVLYFRQSLLLLRLNCPEAAMRSLQLARHHAVTDHERLVYEGWILYDTGNYQEGLRKAEESIQICRSFEAFFLKAYALADSCPELSCSSTVVSLLQEALKCQSDRLRKGQALNNLGSIYLDCEKLELAADCYRNALNIRHTRAHQGLARVYYLKNDKEAAYAEMTMLIEKAKNNASAYEKRSEYSDRDHAKADLEMVTRLDPLRVYPYRYRAAVLMDSNKEKEAIAELSRAVAFKPDLHLLHLRAAFHEHVGDAASALRDCRAALSIEPGHQEILELHSRVHSCQEL